MGNFFSKGREKRRARDEKHNFYHARMNRRRQCSVILLFTREELAELLVKHACALSLGAALYSFSLSLSLFRSWFLLGG